MFIVDRKLKKRARIINTIQSLYQNVPLSEREGVRTTTKD